MGLSPWHLHTDRRAPVLRYRHSPNKSPPALVWLDAPGRFTRTACKHVWRFYPVRSHLDRAWLRPLERPDQDAGTVREDSPGDTLAYGREKKIRRFLMISPQGKQVRDQVKNVVGPMF